MQPSPNFANGSHLHPGRRRGHVPQISISDDNHHVTEAIGDMYGDNDWGRANTGRDSFGRASTEDALDPSGSYFESSSASPPESPVRNSVVSESDTVRPNGLANASQGTRRPSLGKGVGTAQSPPSLTRTASSSTASQHFPLTDIDYESSPAAVAKELSNLQAIRRMSMNVDAADPDLPSFGSNLAIPSLAPGHTASEDDTSRLFWVPAHLHPELAPKEFKTFVEERVDRIRRRSGEENALSPDTADKRRSSGSLGRRRSMLSRAIESPSDYQDGAERLERKRSQTGQSRREMSSETSLHELESLVNDPSTAVRKMSLESARRSSESNFRDPAEEDIPILPPGGQSLKRSTRTNYRKGSLRKGERVPFSRRAAGRHVESDNEEASPGLGASSGRDKLEYGLTRVQTEPLPALQEDFQSHRNNYGPTSTTGYKSSDDSTVVHTNSSDDNMYAKPQPSSFKSSIASGGRTTATIPGFQNSSNTQQTGNAMSHAEQRSSMPSLVHPERTSSHEFSRINSSSAGTTQSRASTGMQYARQKLNNQTLDDMANNPSPIPGNNTRTDSLSIIPTISAEKKGEKKFKDHRSSEDPPRKPSTWGWFRGGDDRDKKDKDREEKDSSKRGKGKNSKNIDKSHDSTRLDVLHTATDSSRGRESLVLDRDSIKLDDERKKESSRKSSGIEGKREGSLLSSLFGGGRKKGEKDTANKKNTSQSRSPEPPRRLLRADIDYNWTRFSILEERAIYRMAHIKLANPRRALYSQVLLSNFMYSYLAKVQQMHPSIQIPQFVTQKGQKRPDQPRQEAQSEEFSQWQRYQEQHGGEPSFEGEHSNSSSTAYPLRPGGRSITKKSGTGSNEQQDSRNLDGSNGQYVADWAHQDSYSEQGLFDDSQGLSEGDLW